MDVVAMKHIASNFAKLDKFEGVDVRRRQKKMRFLLSSMTVVYVLTTLIPDYGDDATVDQLRKRAKWDNDYYACRGLILNVKEALNASMVDMLSIPRDAIFDENIFSSVLRPSLRIPNGSEDIGGSVVPE
ncbi:hypothetical protein Tco_0378544 [Tanacetum coccineum]